MREKKWSVDFALLPGLILLAAGFEAVAGSYPATLASLISSSSVP